MNPCRMAPSLLGFLLSGLSLFAQLPRTGLPSSAPRQVQPQENHALRQQPKSGKSIGQAGKQGPAKALKPLPPRERSLIYRPRRDVRNIK